MSRQKLRLGPTPYGLGCGEHPNLELGPDPRMIQYVGSGKGDSSSLGQGLGVAQSESFHVGKSELQLKPWDGLRQQHPMFGFGPASLGLWLSRSQS